MRSRSATCARRWPGARPARARAAMCAAAHAAPRAGRRGRPQVLPFVREGAAGARARRRALYGGGPPPGCGPRRSPHAMRSCTHQHPPHKTHAHTIAAGCASAWSATGSCYAASGTSWSGWRARGGWPRRARRSCARCGRRRRRASRRRWGAAHSESFDDDDATHLGACGGFCGGRRRAAAAAQEGCCPMQGAAAAAVRLWAVCTPCCTQRDRAHP